MVYSKLALVCGLIAFATFVALPILSVEVLQTKPSDLFQEAGLAAAGVGLGIAGLVAVVAGWYFTFCGYVAHGPRGAWRMGTIAIVLLLIATVSSCITV